MAENKTYPQMEFIYTAENCITSKEWPQAKLAYVKIWGHFAQQVLSYGLKGKSRQGQGDRIVESVLRLLLLSKHKKFEDDAIA